MIVRGAVWRCVFQSKGLLVTRAKVAETWEFILAWRQVMQVLGYVLVAGGASSRRPQRRTYARFALRKLVGHRLYRRSQLPACFVLIPVQAPTRK